MPWSRTELDSSGLCRKPSCVGNRSGYAGVVAGIACLLCILCVRFFGEEQKQLTVYTPQTSYSIPVLDTSESSIEEIASRIMNTTGIERRLPV